MIYICIIHLWLCPLDVYGLAIYLEWYSKSMGLVHKISRYSIPTFINNKLLYEILNLKFKINKLL